MKKPEYWNHNTAYARWLEKRLPAAGSVLDVGCGEGALLRFLDNGRRSLTGLDPDESCIRRARETCSPERTALLCARFEELETPQRYDAILFVASLHHMDMASALEKAKALLAPGGKLLVVGLFRPSNAWDWVLEGLRVLPCLLLSKLHRMQTSEENGVPVSYVLPPMREVQETAKRLLPGAKLRQGLYYRYLLEWRRP